MTDTKVVLGWGGEKNHNRVVFTAWYLRNMTTTPFFGALFGSLSLKPTSFSPFLGTAHVLLVKRTKGS